MAVLYTYYNLCKTDNLPVESVTRLNDIKHLSLLLILLHRELSHSLMKIGVELLAESLDHCQTLALKVGQKLVIDELCAFLGGIAII